MRRVVLWAVPEIEVSRMLETTRDTQDLRHVAIGLSPSVDHNRRNQNWYFAASCNWRMVPVPVMRPKVDEL